MTNFDEQFMRFTLLATDPNVKFNPSGLEKIKDNLLYAAKKDLWHKAPKELPDCETICVTFYNGGYHINVWNDYDKCWDDEEGDDFALPSYTELKWMTLERT